MIVIICWAAPAWSRPYWQNWTLILSFFTQDLMGCKWFWPDGEVAQNTKLASLIHDGCRGVLRSFLWFKAKLPSNYNQTLKFFITMPFKKQRLELILFGFSAINQEKTLCTCECKEKDNSIFCTSKTLKSVWVICVQPTLYIFCRTIF